MCNNNHNRFHSRREAYNFMNNSNFTNWARSNNFHSGFYPPVNIIEEDDHYKIELHVPGYVKEDFRISISDDIMTISSQIKKEEFDFDKSQRFGNRPFKKQFEINEKIDRQSIKAEYTSGILEVSLAKKAEFHTQRTEIKIN